MDMKEMVSVLYQEGEAFSSTRLQLDKNLGMAGFDSLQLAEEIYYLVKLARESERANILAVIEGLELVHGWDVYKDIKKALNASPTK